MPDTPETEPNPDTRPADRGTETPSGAPPDVPENPVTGQRADAPLSLEEIFGILRNERRQHVLSYVLVDDGTVELGDLAEHIAAIENDKPIRSLSSQERKRVYVALYQCHLPKMSDADVIEFDKNRGLVEPGPNIDQLEPYLDVPGEDEQEGVPLNYAVLATAGVLAYLLAVGIEPGGGVVGGVVLGIGLSAFAAMAARARTR